MAYLFLALGVAALSVAALWKRLRPAPTEPPKPIDSIGVLPVWHARFMCAAIGAMCIVYGVADLCWH
uniref:Uncharacterized protein n=1 Tax=Acidobacterium capsulatum TaxID=33075 RepID=A0A7V4XU26_9BACT